MKESKCAKILLFLNTFVRESKLTPIVPATGAVNPADYSNPIPQGLVLTGIVVSVSVSAVMLALSVRLYKHYRTLNLDEIYEMCQKEDDG